MKRENSVRTRLTSIGLVFVASLSVFLSSISVAKAVPSLLDQCVSSINESGFTKEFILDETGFANEAALLSAVSSGAWTLQISTGAGWNPSHREFQPDIYCGDSGNNTVNLLDSSGSGFSLHDYFFGGAGNDTVESMWDSRFWGGSGDDRINNNRERSFFYGGPGNDYCGNRESTGSAIATCVEDGGPLASQASLSIVDNSFLIGNTLTLATSGGSGSGSVSFALVSAGSAGCSVASAVLSATSAGTCTVSATKAADSTYASATTGSVTVTVSKRDQSALSITTVATQLGTTLTLATSGGSGSGSVSFTLVSAGSAGCSVASAVLSATSVGTCTVSATKSSDATYGAATSGATTITVTAVPTTTTIAPAIEIVVVAPSTTIAAAPSTTVAVGQSQIPVVSSVPTSSVVTVAPKVMTPTTTTSSTTTSSTTTTTTTMPAKPSKAVAPKAPSAPSVVAGSAAVNVGGKTETATVERANNQLVVSVGALKAVVGGLNPDGSQMALDDDGNVRLNTGDTVRIKLAGFKPGTKMEAWLFSTPVLLGTSKVGADGAVTGSFTIPKNAPEGAHRVVIVAQTTDGKPATLAVGINVGEWDSGPGVAVWLIVLPIALAVVGGLLLPAQRRRRRAAEEM
jgi:hypothetical protein